VSDAFDPAHLLEQTLSQPERIHRYHFHPVLLFNDGFSQLTHTLTRADASARPVIHPPPFRRGVKSPGTKPKGELINNKHMLDMGFDERIILALHINESDMKRFFRWIRSWLEPF
jgi:hypothetical protein